MTKEKIASKDSFARTQVVVFLYGSAGELDWILPILVYYSGIGFKVSIIYRTRHVVASVRNNQFLNQYLYSPEASFTLIETGGVFSEFFDKLSHKLYRAYVKLSIFNIPLLRYLFKTADSLFKNVFLTRLPRQLRDFRAKKHIMFGEFPSVKRPESVWLTETFSNSIFFYCPHSPHVYTKNLENNVSIGVTVLSGKSRFLLLGDPSDESILNQSYDFTGLTSVFTGHPKYSNQWLSEFQNASRAYRLKKNLDGKVKILIMSRGVGSYLNEAAHKILVEQTLTAIDKRFSNYELLVKKHPRETTSHWDNLAKINTSIEFTNSHILQAASTVDFAISFWTSGAMDCYAIGVPVIEFFDPNECPKQQVPKGDGYTTIYRELGLVRHANNDSELDEAITQLISCSSSETLTVTHPFYQKLTDRSNNWQDIIDKILIQHGLKSE